MVVWIIGLSGAGKTTLAKELVERLSRRLPNIVHLDGDVLREVWGDEPGHDIDGRALNAHRISHLSKVLDAQGINVIVSILSIFPEWQRWNRENLSRYFEVFLDVPMDVLRARDPKGIYKAASAGKMPNVVGVDIEFPVPPAPDLVFSGEEALRPPDVLAEQVLTQLPEHFFG